MHPQYVVVVIPTSSAENQRAVDALTFSLVPFLAIQVNLFKNLVTAFVKRINTVV